MGYGACRNITAQLYKENKTCGDLKKKNKTQYFAIINNLTPKEK